MIDDINEFMAGVIKWGLIIGLPIFGMYKCTNSEWFKQSQLETEANARARATPHVIREADGCKVYAFEAGGNDHFFTRCGEVVTTDRTYTQSCGKNCHKQMTETIVTRGNGN